MIKQELLKVIKDYKSSLTCTINAIYDFIYAQEEENRFQYFSIFMDEIDIQDIEFDEASSEEIDQPENTENQSEIIQLKNTILSNNIYSGKEKNEFYQELWNKMNDASLIRDDEMRKLFLKYLWIDRRIPYYKLGEGCLMEDDEFAYRVEQIRDLLKQALFITGIKWSQKTERASHLIKLADQINDDRTRAVFWGIAIGFIEINSSITKE